MMPLIISIFLILLSYLIGAIPFGLLIVRMVSGRDIREMGSGNIGATNVRRCAGTLWGIATLLCDLFKGFLPTWAAIRFIPDAPAWLVPVVALAAIVGHMFPVYLKFKPSGKGVATALGAFLVAAPAACGLSIITFIVVVAAKRIVSIGSMAAMALLPLFIWLISRNPYLTASGIAVALLIISRHKSNIERLLQGQEPGINR